MEGVATSLNFDTADCHIVGGCDVYTTKAARSDRKLYKNIEQSLEAQYESVLRLSASLSPPNASDAAATLNLSRSSPFGSLSEQSSRRTFAYLIATLNASHPDYDFSHVLRPTDFRRERNLKKVVNTVNSTLFNLRPRESAELTPPSSVTSSTTFPSGSSSVWSPGMWKTIDDKMTLKECSMYSYSPDDYSSDTDDGAIWSLHYFFFNRHRKRVCYIYLRAIPILSHTPPDGTITPTAKRTFEEDYDYEDEDEDELSMSKRTRYWFGGNQESDDDEEVDDGEGEASNPSCPQQHRRVSDDSVQLSLSIGNNIRAMSEEIADSMEV